MPATNLTLEYLSDKYLKDPSEENTDKMMHEIVSLLLKDADVIIDGTEEEKGDVDPAHIEVELDHRFYFHIYSSKLKFDQCHGKHAYVVKFKALMDSIFQDQTFGGITLNYTKGESVTLVSKEEMYDALTQYLKDKAEQK